MKRALRIVVILVIALPVLYFFGKRYTKTHSPQTAATATTPGGLVVKVEYSRPFKKGRPIFGGLVPYGKVWRTGANEATLISFSKDAIFGGKAIKAGQYSLFTIPAEGDWTVILNRQTGQWGLTYDPAQDAARVPAAAERHQTPTEQLTIDALPAASGLLLRIDWDQTAVTIPIIG